MPHHPDPDHDEAAVDYMTLIMFVFIAGFFAAMIWFG
jgi:hypothetical protein